MSDLVPYVPPFREFDATGCALADGVREQFTTYVAFHPELYDAEADLLTLWVLHTHLFGAAEMTPYILVTAPTPAAGKSRILDVASVVAARPQYVVDPTPAALYRMIDELRPTLLIDETDELHKTPGLTQVLNAGYRRYGGTVRRSQHEFVVFCPKMMAGIAGRRLPLMGATLSRCIEVPMRKRLDEPIARWIHRVARAETEALRAELTAWAEQVEWALMEMTPAPLPDLSDRQYEIWEPLAAIAALLGRDWPLRVFNAAAVLSRRIVRQPDEGTQIIADLHDVWSQIQGEKAHSATLAAMRNQLEGRRYFAPLSAHELSRRLGAFDIHPQANAFRIGGKNGRGFLRSAFDDAFARYL